MVWKSRKRNTGYRIAAWLLFCGYLIAMVYFLFFAESMGRTTGSEYHYNVQPFHEISRFLRYYRIIGMRTVVMNLGGNIAAFVPFGLFLPLLSRRMRSVLRVTLISFEVSLMVELIQLVTRVGSCDVDDLILNTLGGFLGYLCFRIVWALYRKGSREKECGFPTMSGTVCETAEQVSKR